MTVRPRHGAGMATAESGAEATIAPVPSTYLVAFVVVTLAASWGIAALTIADTVPDAAVVAIMLTPAVVVLALRRVQGHSLRATIATSLRGATLPSLLFGALYPVLFVGVAALVVVATGLAVYQPGVTNVVVQFVEQAGLVALPVWLVLQAAITYGEELGWRGYLLPALTERHGPVVATAAVGVVWALYHAPVLYLGARITGLADPPVAAAVQAGAVFTVSFAFSCCYYLSRGSVLPVVVFHLVWNVLNPWILGNVYSNARGLLAGQVILVSGEGVVGLTLGAVAAVGFVVLFRRDAFPGRPGTAARRS